MRSRRIPTPSVFSPTTAISPLIHKVRIATAKYLDVNTAMNEGFAQGMPRESGPNAGAMGVHFILPSRLGDGTLKGSEPEALILRTPAEWSLASRRRRVHCLRERLGEASPGGGRPIGRRTPDQLRRRAQSVWSAGVLRDARLGVGAQPQRQLCRLQYASDVREPGGAIGSRVPPLTATSAGIVRFQNLQGTRCCGSPALPVGERCGAMKGNNANPIVLRGALCTGVGPRGVQAQNALVGNLTYSEPLAEVLEGMTTKARSNS